MNIKIVKSIVTITLIFLAGAASNAGMAMGTKPDSKSGKASDPEMAAQQKITWYDGEKKKDARLNPKLIAEFTHSAYGNTKTILPDAKEVVIKQGGVRLWEVADSETAVASLKAKAQQGKYSPVWEDAEGGLGRRALPGGVIVTFNDAWDEARVMEWSRENGLAVERKFSFGNIYVFNTGSGNESLELANRIHESGEVVSASPNWWKEVETK